MLVLLLIFWYCHKRGREVRLEKERLAAEETVQSLDEEISDSASIGTSSISTDEERGLNPISSKDHGVEKAP